MKKKKVFIGCIIAILIVAIGIVGFIVYKNSSSSDAGYTDEDYKPASRYAQEVLYDDLFESTDDATPIPVKLSMDGYDKFSEYLSGVKVNYDFSDLYNFEESKRINDSLPSTNVTKHTNDIRVNGKFDANAFYGIVKKNNKEFLDKQKRSNQVVQYEEYSNKELKAICTEMIDALNDILSKNNSYDVDTVACALADKTILYSTGTVEALSGVAAFDLTNNRFYYDRKEIDDKRALFENNMEYLDGRESDINAETSTMYHEMFHSLQLKCCDMLNEGNVVSIGIISDYASKGMFEGENPTNAYSWFWLTEGSAEIAMANHFGITPSTYFDNISSIRDLDLVTTLLNDKSYKVENICFEKDKDALFNAFGATTDEEKREIVDMMYSIEIDLSNPTSFSDLYDSTYGTELFDESNGEKIYMNCKLREDYFLTLSKYFYKGLAKQVTTGKATQQDINYLIKKWEYKIATIFNDTTDYDKTTVALVEIYHDFYDDYLKIQDEFFKALSNDNDISYDDFVSNYEGYSIMNVNKTPNFDLAFFDDETINDIRNNSSFGKDYFTMRELNQLCQKYQNEFPIDELESKRENLYLL